MSVADRLRYATSTSPSCTASFRFDESAKYGQDDAVVDRGVEHALVLRVRRELDGLVEVVARDHVRATEGVRLDDVLVGGDRVGREALLVDDRAGEAREDLREDLVVLGLQLEDDGRVVGRLDAVEVVEQARRAVRVGDRDVAVERELDVRGGQVVAVGPLEAAGQGDRVLASAR